MAETIAYALVKEEGSLEPDEALARDAGGATLVETWLPGGVVTLKEEDRVGVTAGCFRFGVEVAARHPE